MENGVGYQRYQRLIEIWSEENGISEWLHADDLRGRDIRRLKDLDEEGLVWHMITTNDAGWIIEPGFDWYGACHFCEAVDHLDQNCQGSKGMGWSTAGFFVGTKSGQNLQTFEIEYSLNCADCNQDDDFDSVDPGCPSCSGEGYVTVDYLWPGGRVDKA